MIVLGAGAVEGVVAARLAETGQQVVVVARGPYVEAIRGGGLTLTTRAVSWGVSRCSANAA
ncbi:MAG: hypothetical protein M3O70_24850 [Actinomycetota bacterium]|nr:hypothetical protein [Actinomycetota bacterium]